MTSLSDGRRVTKSSIRIDVIGNVDELNSFIGILLSENLSHEIETELSYIQHDLFDIGAELANSSKTHIEEKQIFRLENLVEKYEANLLNLKEFILPRGNRQSALFHYARSLCRRVERSVFSLAEKESISALIGKYFNRLSDLLFIYARVSNHAANIPDLLWQKNN